MNSETYCHKSIGISVGNAFKQHYRYWYWQCCIAKVLSLVLTLVFTSIINIPALLQM